MKAEERAAEIVGRVDDVVIEPLPDGFAGRYCEDRVEWLASKITSAIRDAESAAYERAARVAESHPYSPAQMDDGARGEIAACIRALKSGGES